jgi:hypothetical protein
VDQVVADEKLTAGWVFLKCHHCAAVSPVQGRAAFHLSQAAEKSLRSPRVKSESKVEFLSASKPQAKPEMILESKPESVPEIKLESKLEVTSTLVAESASEALQETSEEQTNHEPRLEMTASALKLPPVPEFLKSENSKLIETSQPAAASQSALRSNDEPMLFEDETRTSGPVPILLEEEKAPHERLEAALAFAAKLKSGVGEKFTQFRPYALPVALAVVCFGSGSYLIRSARLLRQGSWIFSSPTSALVASDVAPVSDPVAQQEPVVPQAPSAANPHEGAPISVIHRAPASMQTQAQNQSQPQSVASDATLSKIAASAKLRRSATDPKNEKKVEVLADNAVLRAGPGTHYNKVGTARAELQLLVKGQFDNWIEVRTGNGNKTAWIRNDLVKPLKEVAQQEAQP